MAAHSKKMENEVSGWKQSGIFFIALLRKLGVFPGNTHAKRTKMTKKCYPQKFRRSRFMDGVFFFWPLSIPVILSTQQRGRCEETHRLADVRQQINEQATY